ncbi:uncharacterized protein LOC143032858 isoform X3 [Oratosquilla oratoria]|uniref:uncharacterized protein LOC143032858 isoform X3 n=1 Tax=Oratosquilla oratoria TaxID=337810 RepID=UPI003F774461
MHLFLKTLYMLTVMVMTAMMMLLLLLCTPDVHLKLSTGLYRGQPRMAGYGQLLVQSLENPGVYVAEEIKSESSGLRGGPFGVLAGFGGDAGDGKKGGTSTFREAAWDYNGNNTGFLKVVSDVDRPRHEMWPRSLECSRLFVTFARRRTLPRTALASFPGSGNTWLRYLIQGATGLFTGSEYNDRQLASRGFYGENETPECGCTVVVKTHGYSLNGMPALRWQRMRNLDKYFGRGVLLLRNPYDTLIAYRNYLAAGHLGIAPTRTYKGPDWDNFVRNSIDIWRLYALDWITSSRASTVVHYELMKEDLKGQLLRLLHFLRLRVDYHRLSCVLAHPEGEFKRKTPENAFYRKSDPYSDELHDVIDAAIADVDHALRMRDWEPLPTELYNYYNQQVESPGLYNYDNMQYHMYRPDPRETSEKNNGHNRKFSNLQGNFIPRQSDMKSKLDRPRLIEVKKKVEEKIIYLKPWMKDS